MNSLNDEEIKWTKQMPDRRQDERRSPTALASDKMMNIPDPKVGFDRRATRGRRKTDKQTGTVTLTGRAMNSKH